MGRGDLPGVVVRVIGVVGIGVACVVVGILFVEHEMVNRRDTARVIKALANQRC